MLKRRLFEALILLPIGLALIFCFSGAMPHALAQDKSIVTPAASPTPSASPVTSIATAIRNATQTPKRPRYLELGKSFEGSPITATIFGTGKKRVMVFAGIHGNEPDSSIVAKALIGSLGQEPGPEELTIIIVPDVNPDGLLANTRINARGVDLNRNFPSTSWRSDYTDDNQFPGTEPGSEPETRAVINLIENFPPDFIITLHAALSCVNWDGTGEALARVIASANGYPLCPYLGYETPGSLGTYAGTDKKLPVATIELRNKRASELVEENLPALRAVLSYIASAK